MASHVDILDQPEPLGRWFAGSVVLHVSLAAAVASYAVFHHPTVENWGDKNGGGMGAVAVNIVAPIRLPSNNAPVNPVANDTESHVPEPKAPKVQPKPKPVEPDENAIALRSKKAQQKTTPKQVAREYTPPNKYREQQIDRPNQLYSREGQALSSPMIGMTGGGGVGVGTNSPIGTRFGYYADIIRSKVAQQWHTNGLDARAQNAPEVVVRFTLLRNGSVVPASVRVVQGSGNGSLDISTQRAILDASPFGPLPAQYEKDQADLELHFVLRR